MRVYTDFEVLRSQIIENLCLILTWILCSGHWYLIFHRSFCDKQKLRSLAEVSSSAEYSVILTREGSASAEGQNFHFGLTLHWTFTYWKCMICYLLFLKNCEAQNVAQHSHNTDGEHHRSLSRISGQNAPFNFRPMDFATGGSTYISYHCLQNTFKLPTQTANAHIGQGWGSYPWVVT